LSIALLDDWEEKIERMVAATVTEQVTNLRGVPTWTLVLANHILQITGKKRSPGSVAEAGIVMSTAPMNFGPYREQFNN
jgi:hypothetical protein